MNHYIVLPLVVSFILALFLLPLWIRKARAIGLMWNDMNKISREKVAGSGGIIIVLSFITGVFTYIAYRTFYLKDNVHLTDTLIIILVVVLAATIGFVDDLIGWRRGGLSRLSRLLMLLLAAIPLMAINAGKDVISLPIVGEVTLGYVYPLLLIPIGVVGATSAFNFLAGYNGLEAGQGIILLTGIALVAFFTHTAFLALIASCMIMALLAFLLYNYYPAKVFPGDALTYAIGSLVAALAILGNFEKVAVFFFIPYIVETLLKARGKLVRHSFGKPVADGSLEAPYENIYGLEHAAIMLLRKLGIKANEVRVVLLLWAFQLLVVLLGLFIFREGIFML